jgi:NADH:ubiquinone oxidoreductase subunit 5 (subunit L)/multisubunit Na+/H+ antiporter MnhA subunit
MDGQLWPSVHHPSEHDLHQAHGEIFHNTATYVAFATAMGGILLAILFYGIRALSPAEAARQFQPVYVFLKNKWYFDELYNAIFVQPTLFIARRVADFDKKVIDGIIDGSAKVTRVFSLFNDLIDRYLVDGLFNSVANRTFDLAIALRTIQTGNLRQYVMFIVIGTVTLFVLISYFLNYAIAK